MIIDKETLVSDIVAHNYKTATVFKSHKIDFCCNGNRSLENVCASDTTKTTTLIKELEESNKTEIDTNVYLAWDVDFLTDYIYNNHHKYVESKIPEIKEYLNKICEVHGQNHPELYKINTLFNESANDLTTHMKKEELLLFPYFIKLAQANKNMAIASSPLFKTIETPIAMMLKDHDDEGVRFREIASLSNDYTPPHGACTTYKVTYAMLEEFENDLHKHIHLENNILFKKAIELEHNL